jgi:hypothetical protein
VQSLNGAGEWEELVDYFKIVPDRFFGGMYSVTVVCVNIRWSLVSLVLLKSAETSVPDRTCEEGKLVSVHLS